MYRFTPIQAMIGAGKLSEDRIIISVMGSVKQKPLRNPNEMQILRLEQVFQNTNASVRAIWIRMYGIVNWRRYGCMDG